MKNRVGSIFGFLMLIVFMTVGKIGHAQSFNNQAVEAIDRGRIGEAVYLFEQGLRSKSSDRRASKKNVIALRNQKDLPAHTTLHFGWIQGVGKITNGLPRNIFLIIGICSLIYLLYYIATTNSPLRKRVGGLLLVSLCCLFLTYCRAQYLNATDLAVFMKDTALRDKPYDMSDEVQVVFEGQMGQIISAYENFYEIQTDTYETGWVIKDDLKRLDHTN